LAKSSSGNVVAFSVEDIRDAANKFEDSIFMKYELKTLLENPNVETVNGVPKVTLQRIVDLNGGDYNSARRVLAETILEPINKALDSNNIKSGIVGGYDIEGYPAVKTSIELITTLLMVILAPQHLLNRYI